MVVNKPAGLLTQAVEGIQSLHNQLVEQLKHRDQHPGQPFIGLPHRLDRGTSGVVLIAKNQRALRRFGDQFHHRLIQKYYLAWVHGELPPGNALWSDYVRKIEDQPQAEIVEETTPAAKLAQMEIQPVVLAQGQSLVLVRLLTGRMHQIRIQFASRGFPVVGDELYGSSQALSDSEDIRLRPLGLHALRLEFRHPQSAVPLAVNAPVPDYWNVSVDLFTACQELANSCHASAAVWGWPVQIKPA
jgi:23S rRNA pseudouridine1911/1915/1917 synthase